MYASSSAVALSAETRTRPMQHPQIADQVGREKEREEREVDGVRGKRAERESGGNNGEERERGIKGEERERE